MLSVNCGCEGAAQSQRLLVYHGPQLLVDVGFDEKFNPKINAAPIPGIAKLKALVDTGARESCVDSALAVRLGLPHFDRRTVSTVNGKMDVDFHLAQIHVRALRFTIWGPFAAVPLIASGFRCEALLGRSFLSHFKMVYDGPSGAVVIESY